MPRIKRQVARATAKKWFDGYKRYLKLTKQKKPESLPDTDDIEEIKQKG